MKLFILLLAVGVQCAGVAIHNTIVSRIHHSLPNDIKSDFYLPFILAGSFFPDLFYSCSIWKDLSEDIHWPPFLKTSVEYYNSIDEDLELKAFLFGIFTHQLTDVSWHSLRIKQGLMDMVANIDFDGSYSNCHQYLDTAGDFLHLYKSNSKLYDMQWELPDLIHLINIFKKIGYKNVSKNEIIQCMNLGKSGLISELRLINTAPLFINKSPISNHFLESYFIGGLQDITSSIESCIDHLNQWFDGEIDQDPWDLCGAIKPKYHGNSNHEMKFQVDDILTISPYIPLSQFGHSLEVGQFLNEPSIAVSSIEENGSVYILKLNEFASYKASKFQYNSKFGHSLKEIKLFSKSFLLVSEPGSSLIHIFYQNEKLLTIYDFRSDQQYGNGKHKEEFTTLETKNSGDYDDILIGSPFDDFNNHAQSGIVRILSGFKIQQFLLLGIKRIEINRVVKSIITIDHRYKSKLNYEQFGSSISVNEDNIYIGSRGLGVVFVYQNYQLIKVINQEQIMTPQDNFKRLKSKDSKLFGEKILSFKYEGKNYLLINSIYYKEQGGIFIYKDLELVKIITIDSKYSQFSFDFLINSNKLYMSSPFYAKHGAIFALQFQEIFHGGLEMELKDHLLIENKIDEYTGFGQVLKIINNNLVFTEEFFGFNEINDDKKLTGRINVMRL